MSAEWEQHGRSGDIRRLALPLVFVVAGVVAGLLARPAAVEPTFSVEVDGDGRTAPRPAAAADAPGGTWRSVSGGPLSARSHALVASTGDQIVVWGGRARQSTDHLEDGASYDPRTDRWRRLPRAPISGRVAAAAAWNGSELIVWGGSANGKVMADGASYNPATRRWRMLPPAPLSPRRDALAVAVGADVVIWSGRRHQGGPYVQSGAMFDGTTRRWHKLPRSPHTGLPDPQVAVGAVGDDLVVWSSSPRQHRVAAYDGGSNRWRRLSTPRLETGAPPALLSLDGALLAWGTWSLGDHGPLALTFTLAPDWWSTVARPPVAPDGGRLLLGADGVAASWTPESGGIFFDAIANRWERMTPSPEPSAMGWPTQSWVDGGLFVWHGLADPATGRRAMMWHPPVFWEQVTGSPVPIANETTALWTGWLRDYQQVLVWGGVRDQPTSAGAAYDPALGLWESMPRAPIPGRFGHAAAWTGAEMMVVGGIDAQGRARSDGAAYDPVARTWRRLASAPAPVGRGGVAWSGHRLYAAGRRGNAVVVAELVKGSRQWRRLPTPPLRRPASAQVVWTGLELWVVDTAAGGRGTVTVAAWTPGTRAWRRLPTLRGMRGPVAVTWGGRRMFVLDSQGATASLGLSTESWRTHPAAPLQTWQEQIALAWTGRRLVAYLPTEDRLASLDPRAGAWASGAPPPFGAADSAALVWTGRNLFAFGAGSVAKLGGDQ